MFIIGKEYKEKSAKEMFFEPYKRILIQQFIAILSGFLIFFLGGSKALATLTIIMRWLADIFLENTAKFFWKGASEK